MKFEELKDEPKRTLTDTFKFMLGVDDISGTVVEKRIDEAIEADKKGETQAYKIKPMQEGYKTHEDMFSEAQQKYVISMLAKPLDYFGYFKTDKYENKYSRFERP